MKILICKCGHQRLKHRNEDGGEMAGSECLWCDCPEFVAQSYHPEPSNYAARKAAGKHAWWYSPYASDWPDTDVGCGCCGVKLTEENAEGHCRGAEGLVKEMLFTLGIGEMPKTTM